MGNQDDDQAFLNAALQEAQGDTREEKLVVLHYQQAILKTLLQFQSCENCSTIDLTMLKQRVKKLSIQTDNYIATVDVIPQDNVKGLITASRTLLASVGQLCPICQQNMKETILATFRINITRYREEGGEG